MIKKCRLKIDLLMSELECQNHFYEPHQQCKNCNSLKYLLDLLDVFNKCITFRILTELQHKLPIDPHSNEPLGEHQRGNKHERLPKVWHCDQTLHQCSYPWALDIALALFLAPLLVVALAQVLALVLTLASGVCLIQQILDVLYGAGVNICIVML